MEKVKCEFCGKEYSKNGIGTHIWRNHGKGKTHNPNIGFENGDRKIWNKDKTLKTDIRLNKMGVTMRERISSGQLIRKNKGKKVSKQQKDRASKTINEKIKNGNWHVSFSKSRTIEYNGVNFLGSWEVNYAKWLDENKIKWRRPKEKFEYLFEGKQRMYTPDFYLINEGIYVEIKGYPTKKDFAKWDYFPLSLKIISGQILKEMGIIEDYKKLNIVYKDVFF